MLSIIIGVAAGLTVVSSAVAAVSRKSRDSYVEPYHPVLQNTTFEDEIIDASLVPRDIIQKYNRQQYHSGFFKEISDWFVNIWDFVQNVKRYAVFGAKVFLSRIGNRFRMFSEYYSQSNQYRKTIAYSEELIDFQDVPQEILRKYYSSSGNMVDISQELQLYT